MINKLMELCAHNKFMVLFLIGMAVLWGSYSIKNITLDAIPDLSDTQVIIYSRWDRSPDILEDQVTYPIVAALLGAPRGKDIPGLPHPRPPPRPPVLPGLVPARPPAGGAGGGRGGADRRLRAPVPGQHRPQRAPCLRPPH